MMYDLPCEYKTTFKIQRGIYFLDYNYPLPDRNYFSPLNVRYFGVKHFLKCVNLFIFKMNDNIMV